MNYRQSWFDYLFFPCLILIGALICKIFFHIDSDKQVLVLGAPLMVLYYIPVSLLLIITPIVVTIGYLWRRLF